MSSNESLGADSKRSHIQVAAMVVFAEHGYAATSMARIAEQAGVSRPALYQYFDNKADVFRSTLEAALSDAVDAALAELDGPGTVVEQLDGFLQRYHGDLKAKVLASPYGDDLLTFKAEHGADIGTASHERVHRGVIAYLVQVIDEPDGERLASDWCDLLESAPTGFKAGDPSLATYRRRLRTLAQAVAAGIDA